MGVVVSVSSGIDFAGDPSTRPRPRMEGCYHGVVSDFGGPSVSAPEGSDPEVLATLKQFEGVHAFERQGNTALLMEIDDGGRVLKQVEAVYAFGRWFAQHYDLAIACDR